MSEYEHRYRNGNTTPLSKLSDMHLRNIVEYIEERAEQGVVIRYGGMLSEPWYDEEHLNYEDGLNHLNYHEYTRELDRREESLSCGFEKV